MPDTYAKITGMLLPKKAYIVRYYFVFALLREIKAKHRQFTNKSRDVNKRFDNLQGMKINIKLLNAEAWKFLQ